MLHVLSAFQFEHTWKHTYTYYTHTVPLFPTPLLLVYCNFFNCLIAGAVRVSVACDTVLSAHGVSVGVLVWSRSGE